MLVTRRWITAFQPIPLRWPARGWRAGLAVLAATLAGPALPAQSSPQAADQAAVATLVRSWAAALRAADTTTLHRIVAEDYRVTTGGQTITRQEDLAPVLNGTVRFSSATIESLDIRVFADAAVATGVGHWVGTSEGRPFDVRELFTEVWVKRRGQWRAVAGHASPKRQ